MNDHFDTLVAESLRREASHASGSGGGFNDVRRRVRRRRQRNVAAMSLPAVLGVAALAVRTAPSSSGLQPGAGVGATTGATAGATTTGATTTGATTTAGQPSTTVWGTRGTDGEFASTIPANVIGSVVCLNASGDPTFAFVRGCQISVGGGKWLTAGKVSPTSFVMALNPVAKDRADRVGSMLGLKVQPLDTSYLPSEIDLANAGADVVVVMSPAGTPATTTTSTSVLGITP